MTSRLQSQTMMKAMVRHEFGPVATVVGSEQVAKPSVGDHDVLVRVHGSSVNPADWHFITGTPYLVRLREGFTKPKRSAIGLDVAGVVEAVGSKVSRFGVGDQVFGEMIGSFAEYVAGPEHKLAHKPNNLTFEEAGSVPVAALTALQGLRDKGRVQLGQSVLIIGASGGVGSFAVQIAKALGAEVTAVCSTKHVDTVRRLGADTIIDYTKEDFSRSGVTHDLIFDGVGNSPLRSLRRALAPRGKYLLIGGPKRKWLGPLPRLLRAVAYFPVFGRRADVLVADPNHEDLATLARMIDAGEIVPCIGRRYELSQLVEALAYLAEGHSSGKSVITLAPSS